MTLRHLSHPQHGSISWACPSAVRSGLPDRATCPNISGGGCASDRTLSPAKAGLIFFGHANSQASLTALHCGKPSKTGEYLKITAMSDTANLISALETAPGVIIPLIREVPPGILKRRPSPGTWSIYENAIHLSQSDVSFRARLDLILSVPEPWIKTIENSAEDEAGAMFDVDLDESLDRYVRERASLVERLKQLSPEEWHKTAVHEAFDRYSVFIMFRHLYVHEMHHAYLLEQLMLKNDWD